MEKEEFKFSLLQPALSVMFLIAAGYFFSDKYNLYLITHNPLVFIIILLCFIYMIKNLRIGLFTLMGKPAIVLTNESIVITAKNDTIKWTDVGNVYMTYSSIGVINLVKFRFVTIKVREPENYLKMVKNPFIRKYRWLTRNWRTSSFEVSLFLIKGDDDEIYNTILKYYKNNRGF
jgi:hypothetical protein